MQTSVTMRVDWRSLGTAVAGWAVLTCAPWEVGDVLIRKDCLVIQHVGQTPQSGSADDGGLWALDSSGA